MKQIPKSIYLVVALAEIISGLVIVVFGIFGIIFKKDAIAVATGAAIISIGIWSWQTMETKEDIKNAKEEIKEEIRKLGNQLEEIKRMKTRSAGIITEKEFQSKKAARTAKETFQARKNRRVRYS